MSKRIRPQNEDKPNHVQPARPFQIVCSWCGALIRSTTVEMPEQMCLICHARMLNDYFQRLRKAAADSRG